MGFVHAPFSAGQAVAAIRVGHAQLSACDRAACRRRCLSTLFWPRGPGANRTGDSPELRACTARAPATSLLRPPCPGGHVLR